MQDHHISGGRTHQKDAISFRFLDNSHALFSSLERGKILKFQKIRIMPVMLGMKRKLVISRIRKQHLQCILFTAVTISSRKFIKLRILSITCYSKMM